MNIDEVLFEFCETPDYAAPISNQVCVDIENVNKKYRLGSTEKIFDTLSKI